MTHNPEPTEPTEPPLVVVRDEAWDLFNIARTESLLGKTRVTCDALRRLAAQTHIRPAGPNPRPEESR